MANKSIYLVTISNWAQHNTKHKNYFKKTMIANNFCTDPVIQALSLSEAWLYLGLLLVAGNENQAVFKIGTREIQALLRSKIRTTQALSRLQSFQLLTYEEIWHEDCKLKEIKGKEKKVRESNLCSEPKTLVPNLPTVPKPKVEKVVLNFSESKKVELAKTLINSWADTYPKEYLDMEFKKVRSWYFVNTHKAPKSNWGKFINNWLNRGWDQYRKTLNSNPSKLSSEDLQEILAGGL